MPNLVAQDMGEWMRAMESRMADLTRRLDPIRSQYFQYPGGYETGWIDIEDFEAGVAPLGGSQVPQVCRQGRVVLLRGRVSTAGISGSGALATVPPDLGLEPLHVWELGTGRTTTSHTSRYYIAGDGVLNVQGWTDGATATLTGTYGVSGP